jgi:hypothetical protein
MLLFTPAAAMHHVNVNPERLPASSRVEAFKNPSDPSGTGGGTPHPGATGIQAAGRAGGGTPHPCGPGIRDFAGGGTPRPCRPELWDLLGLPSPTFDPISEKVGAATNYFPDYGSVIRAEAESLMLEALAEGTQATYDLGWRQWIVYNRLRRTHPYLDGTSRQERVRDEDELLLYIAHTGVTMKRAVGTIKLRLFAIRQAHITAGYDDPLEGKKRLWLALKGLQKRTKSGQRKLPTTARMLTWLREHLDPENKPDDAVIWHAISMAWFFLMRVGEYAHSGGWDKAKVMTPSSIAFRLKGVRTEKAKDADELQLHFRSSKADQEGAGATRSHFRTGGEVCPLKGAEYYQKHFAHRMRAEPHEPVCRWANGLPVTRMQIQAMLERAAIAEGVAPERFRSHSLRIGGATALYHIYHDVEIIKRYGRWSSNAFHAYLWEGAETSKGVAASMAADTTTLLIDSSQAR